MIIESKSNSNYKYIKKLQNKKYREKFSSYIVESKKLVEEAIKSKEEIDFIFVNEDNIYYQSSYKKLVFSNKLFKELSQLENPEGLACVVKMKEEKPIKSDRVLLLDHIQDPGNLGTLIRSAEAFGFSDIILYNNCVDTYKQKSLRASMGSIFRLNICELTRADLISLKKDYLIYSADMIGSESVDTSKKIILVIGNEANGISEEMEKISDGKVSIAMKGEIESLNAAIAGSILMYKFSK